MGDDGTNGGKRIKKDTTTNFKELLQKVPQDKKIAIFSHAYPDPDAIGSMMGLSWLLNKEFGFECDLFFDGAISHPQNKSMINLLDPQLKLAKEDYKAEIYGMNLLVDTIPANAGVGGHKVIFDVVIDHHKELPNGGYSGLVVHYKTGACCSIIYKLIELMSSKQFEDDNDNDSKVATAMLAGIITDTEYLVSDDSTEMEFDAFKGLFKLRNPKSLKEIVFFKRPKLWVDIKASASVQTEYTDEGYAIVGLGILPNTQRDLIADMADEMITWASVETAIVFALIDGVTIEGSVRSLNPSITVSEFCKKLGGEHGTGGGKLSKGAYKFGLGGLSFDTDDDDDVKTWELIKKKEIKRITQLK